MNLGRRGFLGWAVATIAICGKTGGEKQDSQLTILTAKRCPKCGDWMHLPEKTKRKPNGHYQPVPITSKCRLCDYKVTSNVLCIVCPALRH